VKIDQYFSTFQIPLEPQGGTPAFKNENQNEARAVMGVFPKIFPYCIRPRVNAGKFEWFVAVWL